MKNLFLCILLFSVSYSLTGQSELWSQSLSKDAYISQLDDGSIFIKNKKSISLVDNTSGEIKWENKVSTDRDPRFLTNLPIMYFDGKSYAVIDASTGQVIDESTEKTEILDIHYFWDNARVVMELKRNKMQHILNIDLNDINKSWTIEVGKAQKSMMGLVSRGTANTPSIASDGTLVLVDKKFISLVGESGAPVIKIDYAKNLQKAGFNAEKNILYVVEDKKTIHFLDVTNGRPLGNKGIKEKDINLEVLDRGNTIAIQQKKEILFLNSQSGKEIGRQVFKEKISTIYKSESERYYVLSKKNIYELDGANGSIKSENNLGASFSDLYEVSGVHFVSGSKGTSEIDLDNLKLIFPKPLNMPPVHDYVEADGATIYTYQIATSYTLSVVDDKGKLLWDADFQTATQPTVDVIGKGIFMITGSNVLYKDLYTGKNITKPVTVDPSFAYALDETNDRIVMYSDKRLYFFDTKKGSIEKSKEKFKFKDFDYDSGQSPQIIANPNAIFLKGSNSIFITDKRGALKHKMNYKQSSNTSGFLKLANVAVATVAMSSGNADKVMTVYSGDEVIHKGSMVDDMNDSWAYAESKKAERQAKQNRGSASYPYVFTKLDSGKRGLIFINPKTGKERFDVTLDTKEPNYIVDEVDGVLFCVDKTGLKAIDIK